ncbi:hypothetical protein [Hymenobacter mucosus]|uniref:Uncharacterized protein n=1 Tax=Hymenobacter mucosus TaxID=1411120 RepID=A0A238ZWE1_9BACT|nr:hypothetical protein [Hymenobacter mucosus]SNR87208.1 hypothetical protein SAMN06269173_1104 [Hymenobacter mucosus]
MDAATKKQLRADLKALLAKYQVSICFTCSDSSDTHGLRDDRITIQDAAGKIIIDTDGWHLGASGLKG